MVRQKLFKTTKGTPSKSKGEVVPIKKQEGRDHAPDIVNPIHTPALLYNSMISGLPPFAMRGVLWYQGESNAYQGPIYEQQFSLMIKAWREKFQSPQLPFLFVQLPGYKEKPKV